jgi:hypothetical protein
METGLIILEELLNNSKIEPSFIILLADEGLIDITVIEGKQYVRESQLPDIERFAKWHYDLSINVEGIDVIHNLLGRMREMERELYSLRKLLDYHKRDWGEMD